MAKLSRRQFLKTLGVAGSATLAGCTEKVRYLIPYVVPPEDIVPGEATWYAGTCRECPAGCGMLDQKQGRPYHQGGRQPGAPGQYGQALPEGAGVRPGHLQPGQVYAADGERRKRRHAARILGKGPENSRRWPVSRRSEDSLHVPSYDGHGAGPCRAADGRAGRRGMSFTSRSRTSRCGRPIDIVFGSARIPDYRIDEADFLISFGADFLETWISNVHVYAPIRRLSRADARTEEHVRLRRSPAFHDCGQCGPLGTGSSRRRALCGPRPPRLLQGRQARGRRFRAALSPLPLRSLKRGPGVKASVLSALAQQFFRRQAAPRSCGGHGLSGPGCLETAVAANLLCTLSPESGKLIDFSNPVSLGQTAPASDIKALKDRMAAGGVGALLLYGANPVYNLPASWEFEKALEKVPLVISLSSFPDETTQSREPYFARRYLPRILGRLQPPGKRDRSPSAGHGPAFQYDAPGRHHALSG